MFRSPGNPSIKLFHFTFNATCNFEKPQLFIVLPIVLPIELPVELLIVLPIVLPIGSYPIRASEKDETSGLVLPRKLSRWLPHCRGPAQLSRKLKQ